LKIFEKEAKLLGLTSRAVAVIERAEFIQKGKIQWHMDGLDADCTNGLAYNLNSQEIMSYLTNLSNVEINPSDFEERYNEAQAMRSNGIEQTYVAYEARLEYEKEQEEHVRVKAEQAAEAKRLAEERSKMEADRIKKTAEEKALRDAEEKKLADDRAKFEAEQAAARAEADKKAAEEAEKIRLANEKLEADREAIRKQEAEIEAREKADAERKYLSDWYDAIEINQVMIPDLAIQMNHDFDENRKEKRRADAARAKLISADVEKLNQAHDHVFLCWSKMVPVKKFDTQEGEAAFSEFKSIIGEGLSTFQSVIAGLA